MEMTEERRCGCKDKTIQSTLPRQQTVRKQAEKRLSGTYGRITEDQTFA